jgi:F-type H+-transporting ATPase subunit a
LVFPAVLNALGLLTGVIQAYIFTVLTIVYVSAGSGGGSDDEEPPMDEIGTNGEGATWTNGP